ncbi:mfs multidrug transporter protein [Rutstroemia sp. NJR-2017a BBW]|nr:mfs multidrug transporter protein [Rutstroemia sp. NJR-2017a BBW]
MANEDLEKGEQANLKAEVADHEPAALDSSIVSWDTAEDPQNPKNWPTRKKWRMTLIVSCFAFLSPLTGTMISPSTAAIGVSLHTDDFVKIELVMSIFLLGIGFGPLVLGPLSEMNGRVPVLLYGNLFFILWNTVCGFSQNIGELTAFRLLSGFGGSAPLAVGGGLLSDLWKPEERGRALAIYTAGPLLGPAIGPIIGGYITQHATWRWIFWAVSIASACFEILAFCFLKETHPPQLLAQKAKRLRKETGDLNLRTEYDSSDRTVMKLLRTNLVRPIRMISTQIIIQVLSIYMAVLYGIMFLVLFTFPLLWTNVYHQSVSTGSLNYISTGVGYTLGAQAGGALNDWIYAKLKSRNNDVGTPEFRVALMVPGSILIPIGLFIYGWTGQYHTHWIAPNIGVAVFCMGTIMCFQGIQTYTIDAYSRYAASAISTLNALRSLTGFTFLLFAPTMYDRLGCVPVSIAIFVPAALWKYGASLRKRSTYASGD